MRKVIESESKTYLAPMPVVEKPGEIDTSLLSVSTTVYEWIYNKWESSWIECTGFEVGQEVPEGDWETRYIATNKKHRKQVAIPKQQPERELIKSKIAELEWLIDHGEGALDKGATGDEIMYSHNDFKYDLEDRIEYWEEELKKITNRSRNDQRK